MHVSQTMLLKFPLGMKLTAITCVTDGRYKVAFLGLGGIVGSVISAARFISIIAEVAE